jgi:hypothetical protein
MVSICFFLGLFRGDHLRIRSEQSNRVFVIRCGAAALLSLAMQAPSQLLWIGVEAATLLRPAASLQQHRARDQATST